MSECLSEVCQNRQHKNLKAMKRFDISQSDMTREMTLRNASENRRLVGHLQHLDLQLHQNLVSLQAEIMDLKLSKLKQRPKTSQFGKLQLAATMSDPRQVRVPRRHQQSTSKNSPIQGRRSNTPQSPFLPQISPALTGLVGKRVERHENPKVVNSRRIVNPSNANVSHLSATTNLYKPKSTPDLRSSSAESKVHIPSPPKGKLRSGGEQAANEPKNQSWDEISPTAIQSERVVDLLQSSNTSYRNHKGDDAEGISNSTHPANELIPTINIEQSGDKQTDETTADDENGFLTDEELFRNSLLLKASRDDGFSSSMPDLRSLGFMDFNEVIDDRLRKLHEELPSEDEMRNIRYLRFRDEPAPPSILTVFEKDNHVELEKINE